MPHNKGSYFLLAITLWMLYVTTSYIRQNDASFQDIAIINREVPGHVWLISYADGRDVNLSNQFALVQSAVNKGIDAIRIYNKKDLDKNFLTKNTLKTDNQAISVIKKEQRFRFFAPFVCNLYKVRHLVFWWAVWSCTIWSWAWALRTWAVVRWFFHFVVARNTTHRYGLAETFHVR